MMRPPADDGAEELEAASAGWTPFARVVALIWAAGYPGRALAVARHEPSSPRIIEETARLVDRQVERGLGGVLINYAREAGII